VNPFVVSGPATISFSGGRTSAFMLHQVLEANGGLPPGVHVLFANTGDEHPGTLDFVSECSSRWSVPIHWLEFRERSRSYKAKTRIGDNRGEAGEMLIHEVDFVEVDHATATRDEGETNPIDRIIDQKHYLPNPVTRFCTEFCKLWPIINWLDRVAGYGLETTHVIGIRADEPRRVAKRRAQAHTVPWDAELPLADAGIGKVDVMAFWKKQPFDLNIPRGYGNCVTCFEKGAANLYAIIGRSPAFAQRQINREKRIGGVFLTGRPFASMIRQGNLALDEPEDVEINCSCTD
jgi:3'-phosphoadenosine 5'-phosphosulfate sulfotransferase (PAPS reductase)/FAD synthetase